MIWSYFTEYSALIPDNNYTYVRLALLSTWVVDSNTCNQQWCTCLRNLKLIWHFRRPGTLMISRSSSFLLLLTAFVRIITTTTTIFRYYYRIICAVWPTHVSTFYLLIIIMERTRKISAPETIDQSRRLSWGSAQVVAGIAGAPWQTAARLTGTGGSAWWGRWSVYGQWGYHITLNRCLNINNFRCLWEHDVAVQKCSCCCGRFLNGGGSM